VSQSVRGSAVESVVNVALGALISLGLQAWLLPEKPGSWHLGVLGLFTAASVVRSFGVRRFFEWFHEWWQGRKRPVPSGRLSDEPTHPAHPRPYLKGWD
jgi:hypothetical protein